MAPMRQKMQKYSGPAVVAGKADRLIALDLYYSSAPVLDGTNTVCTGSGEHANADTMHKNVDARWTSQSCEEALANQWTGGMHCPIHKWEIVKSLKELVDSVEKHCGSDHYVRVLRIKGHGNSRGIWVTNDGVTYETLTDKSLKSYCGDEIARLRPHLIPSLSLVLLEHCKAGRAEGMLKKLSEMLGGVAVMASKEVQESHHGRPKLETEIWDDTLQASTKVTFVVCNSTTCVTVNPMEPADLAVHLMKTNVQPGETAPSYIHPDGGFTPWSGVVDVPSDEARDLVDNGYLDD